MTVRVPSPRALAACAALYATAAGAQSVTVASRTRAIADAGTGGAISYPINPSDCQSQEVWSFTVDLPEEVTAPEYWISTGGGCNVRAGDPLATCFQVCPEGRTVGGCVPPIDRVGTRATVQLGANLLVDPREGRCPTVSGVRYIHLRANGRAVARSTTPVRVDLLPPAAPMNVSATRGAAELSAVVGWSYDAADSGVDTDVPDAGDAVTDVTDAVTDVTDAVTDDLADAGDDVVDATAAVDVVTATDVAATPAVESLRGFYLLCDPPPGEGAPAVDGGSCSTRAFTDADAGVDALITRYACSALIAPTERNVVLQNLRAGVSYSFAVVAEDLAGNRSAVAVASGCVDGRSVTDFWEHYRQDGGAAQPGLCDARPGHTGSGLGVALAGLAAVVYRAGRRSRRRTTSR